MDQGHIDIAAKGPKSWNDWVESSSPVEVDFSEATLEFSFRDFVFPIDADFRKTHFELGDFRNTKFLSADFSEARFSKRANFKDSTFRYADFTEAQFNQSAHFEGVRFEEESDFIPRV